MKKRFSSLLLALIMGLTCGLPVAVADIGVSNEWALPKGIIEQKTENDMTLSIALSPSTVEPGGEVGVTVTLTNAAAKAVSVTSLACDLPDGATATGDTTWSGSLDAGRSQTLSFSAALPDSAAGATYTFSARAEGEGFGISAEATAVVVNSDDLELSITPSVSRAKPGEAVTYTVTLKNSGATEAVGIVVGIDAKAGMTLSNVSGGGTATGQRIDWTIDTLAAEATATYTYKGTIPKTAVDGDEYTNTASVAELRLSASASVKVYEDVDLSIKKKVNNRTPEPGATVRYTITVSNAGSTAASDVTVTDSLPDDIEIVSGSISGGGSYSSSNHRITWSVDVPADDEVALTFKATVPSDAEDGDTYVNTARIQDGDSSSVKITVTEDAVPKTGYGEAEPEANAVEEAEPVVRSEFQELYAQNGELVGWLNIPGLVDLPVVQADNNDYYMDHDFSGSQNDAGALFLDERNVLTPSDQHLLIYGHNMKSGAMFGQLSEYRSLDYLKANPVFTFQAVYDEEPTSYVAVAVLDASMDAGNPEYLKIRKPNFDDENDARSFLASIQSFSYYDIPIDVDETDALLSLVTCSYLQDNGRLLIVARPLRDGETVQSVTELMAGATAKTATRTSQA